MCIISLNVRDLVSPIGSGVLSGAHGMGRIQHWLWGLSVKYSIFQPILGFLVFPGLDGLDKYLRDVLQFVGNLVNLLGLDPAHITYDQRT